MMGVNFPVILVSSGSEIKEQLIQPLIIKKRPYENKNTWY